MTIPFRKLKDEWMRDPAFARDGHHLAFFRSPTFGRQDIYVADQNGRGAHDVTHGRGINWAPTWSPDSKTLAFVRFESFGAQLRRADGSLDRTALRRLVFTDERARRQLEALLHPAIRVRTELRCVR